MFGFKRLRRRYRRFRYNNQARFPRLFVVFAMLKLPFQLLLVALPLWVVVGVYNDRFSYEAQLPHRGAVSGTERFGLPEDESSTGTIVAIDRSPPVLVEDDINPENANRDTMVLQSPAAQERALTDKTAKPTDDTEVSVAAKVPGVRDNAGPELLDDSANVIVKSVPFSSIEELRDDGLTVVPEAPLQSVKETEVAAVVEQISGPLQIHRAPADQMPQSQQVYDGDWLAQQADSSFVIQIESSANYAIMQKQALRLSAPQGLAIYPFLVSRTGEVVYGMSYGLFDTLAEAKQASSELPDDLVRFGTWIRQVGTLKRQMKAIEADSPDR